MIAVAAAVVTYGFVMGFIGGATTTTGATQARIVVDAVEATTGRVTVYVRNVGPIPVTVTGVYVYHANGTLADADTKLEDATIQPNAIKDIRAEISLTLGEVYYAKVVTQEGAIATSDLFRVKA